MKIEKKVLSSALKKLGLFVSKKGSISDPVVHFLCKDGKAMMFATDMTNAARVHFPLEDSEDVEFCVNFDQILQAVKIRSKEISVEKFFDRENENGEKMSGIEFSDAKTKFVFALRDSSTLSEMESSCVVPDGDSVAIKADDLKNSVHCAGYARNEKDVSLASMTGVNFTSDDKGIVTFSSTDRQRIAVCSMPNGLGIESGEMSGIMSPKTIASVDCFEDGEEVRVFCTDTAFVLVSDGFESYSPKINANFPNVGQFFVSELEGCYKVCPKDVIESIGIVRDKSTEDLGLEFFQDHIHVFTKVDVNTILEDNIDCERISGEDRKMFVSPFFFEEMFKNFSDSEDDFFIHFRKGIQAVAYECGSFKGMIAPRCR